MRRQELEHLIRAAGEITNELEFIIIGSQSILGSSRVLPNDLTMSIEADIYPLNKPELSIDIEGAIGELSSFHSQYGYYAQGVAPETAVLPKGWMNRLVRIQNGNTNGRIGYCLDPHDLAISKLYAMREKDSAFVKVMMVNDFVTSNELFVRLALTNMPDEKRQVIVDWINNNI